MFKKISRPSMLTALTFASFGLGTFAQANALPAPGTHTVDANGIEDVRNLLTGVSLPLVDKNCVTAQILEDTASRTLVLMGCTLTEVNVQYMSILGKNTVILNPNYRTQKGELMGGIWTPLATCELSVNIPGSLN